MTDNEKNEILASVRAALTGDAASDLVYLQEQAKKYEDSEDTKPVADALLDMAVELLSPEQTAFLRKMVYIGDRTLDQVYREADTLARQGRTAKAIELYKPLYAHITENFRETDKQRYFSFRNLLESNLYHILYHPVKELIKAPFDFTLMIGGYAYALVEVRRLDEAIPVLTEAIRFNPVNPDPRFELAEVYKLKNDLDRLFEAIMDTLPVASSAYALARCYTNLGYWATEKKDYKGALAFYYESLMLVDDPRVAGEIQHVGMLMREPIVPPTREMINAVFAKYQIYHGPGQELMHVARTLAKQAQEGGHWKEAVYYLTVVTTLLHDEEAEKALAEAVKKAEAEV